MNFRIARALEVEVRSFDQQEPLEDAEITLKPRNKNVKTPELKYRPEHYAHFAPGVEPGDYELTVGLPGYETQTREIRIERAGSRELFVLGKEDQDTFQRGPIQVPFTRRDNLVAIAFDPNLKLESSEIKGGSEREEDSVNGIEETLLAGYDLLPYSERGAYIGHTRLYDIANHKDPEGLLKRLATKNKKKIERVGAVIHLDSWEDAQGNKFASFSYLTDQVVVKLKPGVSGQTVGQITSGYKTLRRLPYAANTYLLKSDKPATYDLLADINKLHAHPDVEWAEPNLGGTAELDAPNWDRKRVQAGDARGLLDKVRKARKVYRSIRAPQQPAPQQPAGTITTATGEDDGAEEVVLAIVDSGLDENHEKLSGNKVAALYDFRRMAADNDVPLYGSSHGMKVAGVATAGLGGRRQDVVGVAPGSQIMGLVFPRTEVDILDMYLWAAGLDPGRKSWPPPPERGADVFITSVGFSCCAGAPISGLASLTFDRLTAEGRDGRGCLLFFSAGNRERDCTLDRPWAAADKTLGIAASAEHLGDETLAKYSGFGPVDLCAPSSYTRQSGNISTTLRDKAYTDHFGGTSSATPLAAGVATLVLSTRPELSWTEVRQILRLSAERIDVKSDSWLNADGEAAAEFPDIRGASPSGADGGAGGAAGDKIFSGIFSRRYGYGRVDAQNAVALALRYPRHLGLARQGSAAGSLAKARVWNPLSGFQLALSATFAIVAGLVALWFYRSPGPAELTITLLLALAASHLVQALLSRRFRGDIFDDPAEGSEYDTSDPP